MQRRKIDKIRPFQTKEKIKLDFFFFERRFREKPLFYFIFSFLIISAIFVSLKDSCSFCEDTKYSFRYLGLIESSFLIILYLIEKKSFDAYLSLSVGRSVSFLIFMFLINRICAVCILYDLSVISLFFSKKREQKKSIVFICFSAGLAFGFTLTNLVF